MVIPTPSPATAQYKEIWGRAGITFMLKDDEASIILAHDADSTAISRIMHTIIDEGRFRFDGNSYIPATCITDYNKRYGTEFDDDGEPEWDF